MKYCAALLLACLIVTSAPASTPWAAGVGQATARGGAQARPQAAPRQHKAGNRGQRARRMQNRPPQGLKPSLRRFDVTEADRRKHRLRYLRIGKRERLVRDGEILGMDMSAAARARARALGFRVLRQRRMASLGITLFRLAPPKGMTLEDALSTLGNMDEGGLYEANAIFSPSGTALALPALAVAAPQAGAFSIGVIDTGVRGAHPAFSGTQVIQQNFGRADQVTARDHGTAIASLLVRHGATTLKVADIFSGDALYGDAESVAMALDWLAQEKTAVINMSLTGPDSFLLQLIVRKLTTRGHIIVAAVGNGGPDGPTPYPAAYGDVVGVTAVDQDGQIYEHAGQGDFVDFAAFGVGIDAASLSGEQTYAGTSFAVPEVAALLALQHQTPGAAAAEDAVTGLILRATDLGAPGTDPVFGRGLLQQRSD